MRTVRSATPSFVFALAAAIGVLGHEGASAAPGQYASMSLASSNVAFSQNSDSTWTLDKTGAVNENNQTVTWTVTATETTTNGILGVSGNLRVRNSGSLGATIGNIVVNLQTKSGNQWLTRSSVVADATQDAAATAVRVSPAGNSEGLSAFTENTASDSLLFFDANTNSVFSLAPQVTVAPSQTIELRFQARFKNDLLKLPVGTSIRAEVLVTFGNAKAQGGNTANLDINGNGIIDADEAWVRTVAAEKKGLIPASTPLGDAPVLTDTVADITTTPTVTFTNPVFNLGATSGTVTVNYDPGSSGGTITNCAHLIGGNVNLQACDTQTIDAPTGCTPGEPGCGWLPGDVVSYTQASWGDPGQTGGQLVNTWFNAVYQTTGVLEVGIAGPAGFSMAFTSAAAILAYQPAVGPLGSLTSDLLDPTTSSSGAFGGEVVALRLNIDFSDIGLTLGGSGIPFGDLVVCGTPLSAMNGQNLRFYMQTVNSALGGGSAPHTITELNATLAEINGSFLDGQPSTWAQQHLFPPGPCPHVWQPGDVVSYTQASWGDPGQTGGQLVNTWFNTVYSTNGFLEVGIAGPAGFSMVFTSASAILAYQPAFGPLGALTSDLLDPTTTSAGVFGGEVVALRLNIDFSDIGLTLGGSGIPFGDLVVCGTPLSGMNGQNLRFYMATVNSAIGGGSAPHTITELNAVLGEINFSFMDGQPSLFAQAHLFPPGPCP